MSRRLEGQTAWISGAASGIGAGTARLFAQEGANVALADHRADQAEALAAAIRADGGQALAVPADVTDESAVRASIDRAAEHFGGLQILVNSAGIVRIGPLHETAAEDWNHLLAINVGGIFFAVKHAIPHLRRHRRSYVVNLGSISSFVGQASTPAYTTSKAAVLGLSRSIALDYAAIGLRWQLRLPRHHRHADAAGAPGQDARPRGHPRRPAPPRPPGDGPDPDRHRPRGPLLLLRGFRRGDGHLPDHRRRLPRRRGVGRRHLNLEFEI